MARGNDGGDLAATDPAPPVIVASPLDPGAQLGGRYRLIARLGSGGGGAVWRAFDAKVGEEVALKLLETHLDVERWRREVALARRISHRNVCRVYDLGEAELDAAGARALRAGADAAAGPKQPDAADEAAGPVSADVHGRLGAAGKAGATVRWVTMELIEGKSLRALLAGGELREPEPLMLQLVEAVAAIHAAGVVHRDLKPENVVVDRSGRAVVVDFGLARTPPTPDERATTSAARRPAAFSGGSSQTPRPAVTVEGAVLGTPGYMAPEQSEGRIADARSDVYSLGLLLRELATAPTADRKTAANRGEAMTSTSDADSDSDSDSDSDPDSDSVSDSDPDPDPDPDSVSDPDSDSDSVSDPDPDSDPRRNPDPSSSSDADANPALARLGATATLPASPAARARPKRRPSPSTNRSTIPAAAAPLPPSLARWAPLLARCTAPAPAARFADATALREALLRPRLSHRRRLLLIGAATAALAAAAFLLLSRRGPPPPLHQARLVPASSNPERPLASVALSADGRRLAYSVGDELWQRPVAGGPAEPVAVPLRAGGERVVFARAAAFFPDGQLLAALYERQERWSIWSLGAAPRLLYRAPGAPHLALSPSGALLAVATDERGLELIPASGGASRSLVPTSGVERFGAVAWSPDGKALAFLRYKAAAPATLELVDAASGRRRVVGRGDFGELLAWPAARRLILTERVTDAVLLRQLALDEPLGDEPSEAHDLHERSEARDPRAPAPATLAAVTTLLRWPDEHVAAGAGAAGRLVVLRGGLTSSIALGNLAPRGYLFRLRSLDDGPAAAVAGWLDDDRLVYAAPAGLVATRPGQPGEILTFGSDPKIATGRAPPPSPDQRELLLAAPAAPAAAAPHAELDDLPLTLAGSAVLHRRADGALRHLELAPRGDRALPAATGAIRAVRCAGDRAAPCLAQLVTPDAIRYLAFDPQTGALGAELYRTAPGASDHPALSPDGKTLVVASGRELRLVSLPDGGAVRHPLRPDLEPRSLSWSSDGRSVFLSTVSHAPPRFTVWRVSRDGVFDRVIESEAREYGRVADSRDGSLLALEARDSAAELWLVEGLAK